MLPYTTYISTVADHVCSFMETLIPCGCGLFAQDNTLCHRVKLVRNGLRSTTMSLRPPNSPDLNSIQHLLGGQGSPIHGGPPHNLQVLKDLSLTSWSQKPQHTFSILMDTMHLWVRVILAVLALFKQCLNSNLLIELSFLYLCQTPRFSAF